MVFIPGLCSPLTGPTSLPMAPSKASSPSRVIAANRIRYKVNTNVHGWNLTNTTRLYVDSLSAIDTQGHGITLGAFGGVAGVFALFFFSDIPRVRKDIMQAENSPYWTEVREGDSSF
ncbi:hypothetical protein D0Z07_4118 [Hyphodiscus hymeniophilus]|uniref:Uncharacterized protein n=1 Tax=Hyphodiscus hymeniophilus TaxID=353542 RepID=A0A9P6VKR5_9HELO|nr:hypothetical protein D0Z07_4118 [Hyphodiscus hymeniophilus]